MKIFKKKEKKIIKFKINYLVVLFFLVEMIYIFVYYMCKIMLILIKLYDIGI